MLHVDLAYVGRVGMQLQNFAQKNQYLWNCSCPVCGDVGDSGRKKKRFYVYRPGTANHLNAKCHKCGYSSSFGGFMKSQFPQLYKEYVLERYHASPTPHVPHKNISEVMLVPKAVPNVVSEQPLRDATLDGLKCCDELKDSHPVAKFLLKRMIPRNKWELIYYALEFKKYTNSVLPGKFKDTKDDHPRLVIPYFNDHGKVFAFVARAFDDRQPRYMTIKLDDSERVYGQERLDTSKRVYAVEGAIDSLFLPNCIAVSGSNFDCETTRPLKSILTLVPDNEPRSPAICKLINKHIRLGYRVCMLPHTFHEKDINEMILNGRQAKDVLQSIDEHTYQGAAAVLRFSQWKLV